MFTKMKIFESLVGLIFLLVALSTKMFCSEELETVKYRRPRVQGMTSFARVSSSDDGRSNGNSVDNTDAAGEWDESMPLLSSNEEYNDYSHHYDPKRVAIVSYPRVGHSGGHVADSYWVQSPFQEVKRASAPSANGGMWFGPRLGRSQKRETRYGKSDLV